MPHLDILLPYLKPSSKTNVAVVIAPNSSFEELKSAASSSALSTVQSSQVCALVLKMIADAVPVEGLAFKSR